LYFNTFSNNIATVLITVKNIANTANNAEIDFTERA
jgi:hypothetical protein